MQWGRLKLNFTGVETMEAAEMRGPEPATLPKPDPGAVVGTPRGLVGRIVAWDLALLRWMGSLALPAALSRFLILFVRIGDGWIWLVVLASLLWALPLVEVKTVVAHCLTAFAMSLLFYWPVKLLVRRARPHELDLGVTAKVPPLDKFSFPSGHTMNNLAVALTLSLYVPAILPFALGLPLLLGMLRILYGVHFLSDITAGALLGVASFALGRLVFLSF
jgi:undecaprenyl-diphosphatase